MLSCAFTVVINGQFSGPHQHQYRLVFKQSSDELTMLKKNSMDVIVKHKQKVTSLLEVQKSKLYVTAVIRRLIFELASVAMLFLSLDSPLLILPTCIGCKFIISLRLWFKQARKWGFQSLTKLKSVCTFAKYLCESRLSICILF